MNGPDVARIRYLARHLRPAIVALDGPAASGKSTVGMSVAETIDYLFFDTGAMYRAVTWAVLDRQIAVDDVQALGRLVGELTIDVAAYKEKESDQERARVLVDGYDASEQLRSQAVNRNVSIVSAVPKVRAVLSRQQRAIATRYGAGAADRKGIVLAGRDIGTVVVPDAKFKVYLDASLEERAMRRYREQIAKGDDTPFAVVLKDIRQRDQLDQDRAVSPLRAADDALVVDTTGLHVTDVVSRVLDLFSEHVSPLVGRDDI